MRATASAPPDTALGRTLVLLSVILATTLYATTLTIANVALPQMQGNDLLAFAALPPMPLATRQRAE